MSRARKLTLTPSSASCLLTFSLSENRAIKVRRSVVPARLALMPALAKTSVIAAAVSREMPNEDATGAAYDMALPSCWMSWFELVTVLAMTSTTWVRSSAAMPKPNKTLVAMSVAWKKSMLPIEARDRTAETPCIDSLKDMPDMPISRKAWDTCVAV